MVRAALRVAAVVVPADALVHSQCLVSQAYWQAIS